MSDICVFFNLMASLLPQAAYLFHYLAGLFGC